MKLQSTRKLKKMFFATITTLSIMLMGSVAFAAVDIDDDAYKTELIDISDLTGSTMLFYSVDNNKNWIPVTGTGKLDVSTIITTRSRDIYFMHFDDAGSQVIAGPITIPARPKTDGKLIYDAFTGTLKLDGVPITGGVELKTPLGTWIDGDDFNPGFSPVAYSLSYRVKATGNKFASVPMVVAIPAVGPAPKVTADYVSVKVKGTNPSMEYTVTPNDVFKPAGNAVWTSCLAGETPISLEGADRFNVHVRMKGSNVKPPSLSTTLTNFKAQDIAAPVQGEDFEIDYTFETLDNKNPSEIIQYSLDNGIKYVNLPTTGLALKALILPSTSATRTENKTILLRFAPVDTNSPASLPERVEIKKRPAAPPSTAVTYDPLHGKLIFASDAVKRSLEQLAIGTVFSPFPEEDELASADITKGKKYTIRYTAIVEGTEADKRFASDNAILVVSALATISPAPVVAVDYAGESLRYADFRNLEYRIDGTEGYTDFDLATPSVFTPSKVSLENFLNKTIFIRVKATETKPASPEQKLIIRNRAVAPTTPTFANGKFTGLTTAMEYSTDSGETWNLCRATTLVATPGIEYLFRLKATATAPASAPVSVLASTPQSAPVSVEATIPVPVPVPEPTPAPVPQP